jgi:hypothetical protein
MSLVKGNYVQRDEVLKSVCVKVGGLKAELVDERCMKQFAFFFGCKIVKFKCGGYSFENAFPKFDAREDFDSLLELCDNLDFPREILMEEASFGENVQVLMEFYRLICDMRLSLPEGQHRAVLLMRRILGLNVSGDGPLKKCKNNKKLPKNSAVFNNIGSVYYFSNDPSKKLTVSMLRKLQELSASILQKYDTSVEMTYSQFYVVFWEHLKTFPTLPLSDEEAMSTPYANTRYKEEHTAIKNNLKQCLKAIHQTVASKATTIAPFSKLRPSWPKQMVFSETTFVNVCRLRMQKFCGELCNFILVGKVSYFGGSVYSFYELKNTYTS